MCDWPQELGKIKLLYNTLLHFCSKLLNICNITSRGLNGFYYFYWCSRYPTLWIIGQPLSGKWACFYFTWEQSRFLKFEWKYFTKYSTLFKNFLYSAFVISGFIWRFCFIYLSYNGLKYSKLLLICFWSFHRCFYCLNVLE